MSDNAITLPDPVTDKEWQQIVDDIVACLEKDDLPDDVIRATEMLLVGYSMSETAKELNIPHTTIRRWITNPVIAQILADRKSALIKWRMAQLEKQFLKAVQISSDVLDASWIRGAGIEPKVLAVVAQQARYVIGLFAGQQKDINVVHNIGGTLLKAKDDALDYIANRLAEQRQNADVDPIIDGVFRVVDPKFDRGPVLNADGSPIHGQLGILDHNDQGYLCHVCGSRLKYLADHIKRVHNIEPFDYETTFMLERGKLRETQRA